MNKSKTTMLFIAPALFSYAGCTGLHNPLAIQDKQGDIFSWTYAGIYAGFTLMVKRIIRRERGLINAGWRSGSKLSGEISDTGHYFHHCDGDSRDILEGMNGAGLSFGETL